MKNFFYSSFFIVLLIPILIIAQSVTGKLVDENGAGLAEVQLQLYAAQNVYNAVSLSDGSFTFDNVTGVEDNLLPTGYEVSNNFPNPFNPTTRIGITLPGRDNVKVEVFNLLGQTVADVIEKSFNAGTNFIDLELNGLPNGLYFARITIDDKYSVTKKMMLIYGSQHLAANTDLSNTLLNKSGNNYNTDLEKNIDSLVVVSSIIGKKTFTNLPEITTDALTLGNLTIESSCRGISTVRYKGKIYNTIQIGTQCWLKENLDVGTMILGSRNQTNNRTIEKYCYNDSVANCETYGALYQWAEVMQYGTTEGAQGICPPGWHLPTKGEFKHLSREVGNDGNALKEIGQGTGEGAGTNTSGFSALLAGGLSRPGIPFGSLGLLTSYWTSTQVSENTSMVLILTGYDSLITLNVAPIGFGWSVRCLMDGGGVTSPQSPVLSFPANGDTNISLPPNLVWNASIGATSYTLQVSAESSFTSFVFNQGGLTSTSEQITSLNNSTTYFWRVNATNSYGTSDWSSVWNFTTESGGIIGPPCPGIPTITYEGKTYNTVQIGEQCWLRENLDIGVRIDGIQNANDNGIIEKYCYDDSTSNCSIYGGLYQWNEAMQYVTSEGAKGICPDGWHLPTISDLQILSIQGGNALKEIGQGTGEGAGTNTSGFSALLAGARDNNTGAFYSIADYAYFWCSTEFNASLAVNQYQWSRSSDVRLDYNLKERGLSVRCIKD